MAGNAPALYNQHLTCVAINFEAIPGTTPADAAAWVAGVGTTVVLMFAEELDPTFIRGDAAVPNIDMEKRVYAKKQPHHGLPTADGGSMVVRTWGSEETYAAGTQVAENALGRLLVHSLGGGSRGNHTDIAVVTSQTEFDVTLATDLAVGQIIGFEDTDDVGRVWPAQITAIAGVAITIDREMPFVVVVGDLVVGADNAYPEQAALTNPQDVNYSTISMLITKGTQHAWMLGGGHLGLTEIRVERGQQPRFAWEILAAQGYPQGDGAPAVPAFTTSPVSGSDVKAIGRDTRCFLQEYGTSTSNYETLFSAAITPGVPVLPQETVTEADDGMPGRAGYRTEPADSMLELVVALTDEQQDRWTAGTLLTVTYHQVAATGACWAVHGPKCFLMEAPELVLEGTNHWRIRLQLVDDDSATGELGKAKVVIARY